LARKSATPYSAAIPRHLYHDVLIAIDEERLNNGQPTLWARMYDSLGPSNGAHVVHVGTGTGYYSAILAEIVGRSGRVTAIEIDPALAAAANETGQNAGISRGTEGSNPVSSSGESATNP